MARLTVTKDHRTTFDAEDNVVRSFFGAELVEPGMKVTSVGEVTDEFLAANADLFRLDDVDLERVAELRGSASRSIRFEQKHENVPVYGANLVVAIRDRDNRVMLTVNRLEYDLPDDLTPANARLTADEAIDRIHDRIGSRFGRIETTPPKLFVYRYRRTPVQPVRKAPPIRAEMLGLGRGSSGQTYLVWQVKLKTTDPRGSWEILVDTEQGQFIEVKDRRRYASAPAMVFHPDPITSSKNPNLSSDTQEQTLDLQQEEVTLQNLDPPPAGAPYTLTGTWVRCAERVPPEVPAPEEPAQFVYGSKDPRFLNVMAYYYLDRLITSLRGRDVIAYNEATLLPIDVDPQGEFSSFEDDNPPYIELEETGVPDASDPAVAVHEYGHVIHHYLVPLYGVSYFEEGFCDFLAACWLDRFNTHQFQRELVFPWDNNQADGWDQNRRVNLEHRFDDQGFQGYDGYLQGGVFATGLWDFFLNIGGSSPNASVRKHAANEAIATYLEMLVDVQSNYPPENLVKGMIEADKARRTGGLYQKVIWDAFRRRGLWDQFTAIGNVDVWIHDHPNDLGDHAGPKTYWKSPDIWTRQEASAVDADPDAGHQTPIVGLPNYVYVRVHNRGTQVAPANSMMVEAFHCDPGTGMLWPDDFTSMGALGVTEDIPAGGSVRVGPFDWTPQLEDHACLLAVVDGPEDVTVAGDLAAPVSHSKLVRFDNNVGQRNVSPQDSVAGGCTEATFLVRGGRQASANLMVIDSRVLPIKTKVRVRLPRRLTDHVKKLDNLSLESENSRYSVLGLNGGTVAKLKDFTLKAKDKARITVQVDLPSEIKRERIHPIDFIHERDGEPAGGMTYDIVAVEENDNYFFGNRRSKELHTVHCSLWPSMTQRNKVPFSSIKEAVARGYKPCSRCLSDDKRDRLRAIRPGPRVRPSELLLEG